MSRTVHCARLHKDLPGLDAPPFPGKLGERIFEQVSAQAYEEWQPYLTKIMNHYGLNPADAETRQMLRKEMEAFFFGTETMEAENLSPDTVQQAN